MAIGRPKGRSGMPGSGVRPVWQVISDLGDLGVVTGAAASEQLFDGRAVLRRAHARRDRRPRDPLARARPDWQPAGSPRAVDVAAAAPAAATALRLGTYRTLWAAKEVDASPILQFAIPRQIVELSPEDAARARRARGRPRRGRHQRHAACAAP